MDWFFFGNDSTNVDEARSRFLVAQAITVDTLIVGPVSFGIYPNYEVGLMLVFGMLCLSVTSMSYAHAIEFRRHLLNIGGAPTLSTDDFATKDRT